MAVGTGSPVTVSTLFTPSIFKPSKSAFVALILRSRHVIWGIAVIPSSLDSLQARTLLSILAFAIGQSAISTASTPAYLYLAAPSIKKSISGSTGGSNSTTMTFLPPLSFSAKAFLPLSIPEILLPSSPLPLAKTLFPDGRPDSFPEEITDALCLLYIPSINSLVSREAILSISSGAVPQHPPTIEAPASRSSMAFCPKYSLSAP